MTNDAFKANAYAKVEDPANDPRYEKRPKLVVNSVTGERYYTEYYVLVGTPGGSLPIPPRQLVEIDEDKLAEARAWSEQWPAIYPPEHNTC